MSVLSPGMAAAPQPASGTPPVAQPVQQPQQLPQALLSQMMGVSAQAPSSGSDFMGMLQDAFLQNYVRDSNILGAVKAMGWGINPWLPQVQAPSINRFTINGATNQQQQPLQQPNPLPATQTPADAAATQPAQPATPAPVTPATPAPAAPTSGLPSWLKTALLSSGLLGSGALATLGTNYLLSKASSTATTVTVPGENFDADVSMGDVIPPPAAPATQGGSNGSPNQ